MYLSNIIKANLFPIKDERINAESYVETVIPVILDIPLPIFPISIF